MSSPHFGITPQRLDDKVLHDLLEEDLNLLSVVVDVRHLQRADVEVVYDEAQFLSTVGKMIICQRQDITFLAVGKGPQWDFYNNQIDEGERKLIKMLGRWNDVDEIYQARDLTVLTSFHGEGVSNSIMELMAWGGSCDCYKQRRNSKNH